MLPNICRISKCIKEVDKPGLEVLGREIETEILSRITPPNPTNFLLFVCTSLFSAHYSYLASVFMHLLI